jgi:hypothetical protein
VVTGRVHGPCGLLEGTLYRFHRYNCRPRYADVREVDAGRRAWEAEFGPPDEDG